MKVKIYLPTPFELFVFLIFLLVSLFTIHYSPFTSSVSAQVPAPYVPCSDVRGGDNNPGDEFHSLRPYQASPCDEPPGTPPKEDLALFCGNNLVLVDTISNTTPGASCQTQSDGTIRCRITRSKNIAVDLSGANLPFMGNTEEVANYKGEADKLEDAEKMSEYVSWYLQGIIGRAEYSYLDAEDEEDIRKIVDYSGPLRKLLSWDNQAELRVNTIMQAVASKKGEANLRHDQIVGCTYGIEIKRWGLRKVNFLGIQFPFPTIKDQLIGGIPAPCYDEGILAILTDKLKVSHRLSAWEHNLPPIRSELNADGTPKYKEHQDYWKDYQEWRGQYCFQPVIPESVFGIEIPIIGGKKYLICGEDILKPNFYSNMFSYIPFSSTEDKKGLVEAQTPNVQPGSEGLTISNVSFSNQQPAELFFAHMEEVSQLAEILQSTYVAKGEENNLTVSGVSPSGSCDLANVRTNKGDDLFAGEIAGTLAYTAEFTCSSSLAPAREAEYGSLCYTATGGQGGCVSQSALCNVDYGRLDCGRGYKCGIGCVIPDPCTKEVMVNLSVVSKTPMADEVWSRLVAGPTAVFKRMFPKVGPGGAILGILDIPAATKITYSSADGTPVMAGNPGTQRSGESAELYFPHLGGVSEYFLKGIQTILRPKGYGQQVISGQATEQTIRASGDICNIASTYKVPCEFLQAIWKIETNLHPGGEACGWESAAASGPMQITRSTGISVTTKAERTASDPSYFDRCLLPDAYELAARVLLYKKYCTLQSCDYRNYDPTGGGTYSLSINELDILGRYHGTNNCAPSRETQCRWGTGYSYCDAAVDYLNGVEWPVATPAEREIFCSR